MIKPSTHSRETEDFPLFDWLRFVLASVVALAHENVITWGPAGNFAVQIFFALSGWLIGGILLRTDVSELPKFFYNRGTRIWIPYLFAVAVIYLLSAARDPINQDYFEFLFYDLTFTHNWFIQKVPSVMSAMPLAGTGTHFWSISVEEQFYLAAPLLIVLLPLGRSIGFWLVLVVVAITTQSFYGSISLGVLAAVVRNRHGDWHLTSFGSWSVAGLAAALSALIFLEPACYRSVVPYIAIAIVLIASRKGSRGAIGRFVGGISYPLYLHHWMGMFAANFIAKHSGVVLPSIGWTAYLFALVAGSLAYVVVDQNVMRFRGTLYRPALGRSMMIIAYTLFTFGVVGGAFLIQ